MIIVNGYIECKRETGGGLDPVTRYPVTAEASWGEPIPCQYIPVRHDALAVSRQGESYTLAAYTILIEEQPLQDKTIRLTDRSGVVLGEFPVRQIEPLDAVCEVRITV